MQPFLTHLTGHFKKDSATVHTARHSMQTLHELFDDRVINHGFWPTHSPDGHLILQTLIPVIFSYKDS
jgi:hypothetical protein